MTGLFRAGARAGHDCVRTLLWRHGHRLRRARPIRPASAGSKKVVHVTTSFDLGGTQTQIKQLVTATSSRYAHATAEMFPELNYLFRQGVTVDAARYSQGGAIARAIGRTIADRNRRGFDLVQAAKLVRDFECENAAVVVGWGHEICVTTFVAAAWARVPHIVFCIRTFNPAAGWTDARNGARLQAAHRRMAPLVSAVVVNSSVLQEDYAAWAGLALDRVRVCANGIAMTSPPVDVRARARRQVRAALAIPDDALVIAHLGRFSKEKGQRSLVEANRLMASRVAARVVWLLCGDGPLLSEVQSAAASAGMDNMRFPGRTSDVVEALAAADVFVMPSDFEGMPNAMMEAMAMGLPCVSTRRSGIRDVAREGIEALYYDAGDVPSLVQHLQALANDPGRRHAIGTAAALRIQEFSIARFVRCFDAVLDGLPQ